MAAGKDRSVRRPFRWVDIESKDLVAAAGIDNVGRPPLASQHY